jgi:glyoxylase-like metal-dependent hydrolase (beta-lactamase superfamily II)
MRIHHLSCGTMCPHGGRFIGGEGGPLNRGEIICHCLLIEAKDSLILVDTGIGLGDCATPRKSLGVAFAGPLRAVCDPQEAAVERVRALGLDPADVRHIVPTHLDPDHSGGLPDFPASEVHVFGAELDAALHPRIDERLRYRQVHFAHGPKWTRYEAADGEGWFGFESVRAVPGSDAEVLLIPLPGHSRGHCGVAVRDGDGWMFHCGDAYFHRNEVADPPSCPPLLRAFQNITGSERKKRLQNQQRLRDLARDHGEEVRMFSAHDHVELAREQAAADPTT